LRFETVFPVVIFHLAKAHEAAAAATAAAAAAAATATAAASLEWEECAPTWALWQRFKEKIAFKFSTIPIAAARCPEPHSVFSSLSYFKHQVLQMAAVADPSTPLSHDAVAIVGAGEIAKVFLHPSWRLFLWPVPLHLFINENMLDY
jgi:hypothetical protein